MAKECVVMITTFVTCSFSFYSVSYIENAYFADYQYTKKNMFTILYCCVRIYYCIVQWKMHNIVFLKSCSTKNTICTWALCFSITQTIVFKRKIFMNLNFYHSMSSLIMLLYCMLYHRYCSVFSCIRRCFDTATANKIYQILDGYTNTWFNKSM